MRKKVKYIDLEDLAHRKELKSDKVLILLDIKYFACTENTLARGSYEIKDFNLTIKSLNPSIVKLKIELMISDWGQSHSLLNAKNYYKFFLLHHARF